jgi:tetratricopeptide (TPR) repeat protein
MKNNWFTILTIVTSIIALAGCMPFSKRMMEYPVTEIPKEKLETVEASIFKLTPIPVPEYVDFSQEVEDIEDQAIEEMIPLIAIKQLEDALAKEMPDFQRAYVYMTLGMKYEDLNNAKKAIENYSKSIELYEGNSYAILFRGELYFQQGNYELAKQDIHKAIGLDGLDEYNRNEGFSYLIQIESREK